MHVAHKALTRQHILQTTIHTQHNLLIQGSVAMCLSCGGIFNGHFMTSTAVCGGERIVKIEL